MSRTSVDSVGALADLLGRILRGTPPLPRALCRGKTALFDADTDETAAEAVRICGRCPELAPCRAWRDGLGRRALTGVVAGEIRRFDETGRRPA